MVSADVISTTESVVQHYGILGVQCDMMISVCEYVGNALLHQMHAGHVHVNTSGQKRKQRHQRTASWPPYG
jgi:hypothetical protein